jgi:hypothetical protein
MKMTPANTYEILGSLLNKAAKEVGVSVTFTRNRPTTRVYHGVYVLEVKGKTVVLSLHEARIVASPSSDGLNAIWQSSTWNNLDTYGLQLQLEDLLRSL